MRLEVNLELFYVLKGILIILTETDPVFGYVLWPLLLVHQVKSASTTQFLCIWFGVAFFLYCGTQFFVNLSLVKLSKNMTKFIFKISS